MSRLNDFPDINSRTLFAIAELGIEVVAPRGLPKATLAAVVSWLDDAKLQLHRDDTRWQEIVRGQITFKIPMGNDKFEYKKYEKQITTDASIMSMKHVDKTEYMYHAAKEVLRLDGDIILMLSTLYEHPRSES